MKELLSIPLFSILLTLGAYQLGLWCQRNIRSSLANPLLISILLVLAALWLTGLPNAAYQAGASSLSNLRGCDGRYDSLPYNGAGRRGAVWSRTDTHGIAVA